MNLHTKRARKLSAEISECGTIGRLVMVIPGNGNSELDMHNAVLSTPCSAVHTMQSCPHHAARVHVLITSLHVSQCLARP